MFKVYSKPNCPGCTQAKNLISSRGLSFADMELNGPYKINSYTLEELNKLVPGVRTVPQIFYNDKHIGGLKELKEFFENLDSTLSC